MNQRSNIGRLLVSRTFRPVLMFILARHCSQLFTKRPVPHADLIKQIFINWMIQATTRGNINDFRLPKA